jgi:hypothetical protein
MGMDSQKGTELYSVRNKARNPQELLKRGTATSDIVYTICDPEFLSKGAKCYAPASNFDWDIIYLSIGGIYRKRSRQ